jgi:hypothetical protein
MFFEDFFAATAAKKSSKVSFAAAGRKTNF